MDKTFEQSVIELRQSWINLVKVLIEETKIERLMDFLGLQLKQKYKI